ncbi:hypothetical protein M2317_000815 [Microbacterium sp. ZKA21]|uniref:hypothetical protein n=1 Tax=Microbacterium sp. ZKA21 TaxID=3381694 RepID=UPI003D218CF2
MTEQRNAPAAVAPADRGEIVSCPIPEENPNTDSVSEWPCSIYSWCRGHDSLFPESDGAHFAEIRIGEYAGGEPRELLITRYEVSEYDEQARWSFALPDNTDWTFDPDAVDEEISGAIDELLRARTAIREFLALHDVAVPE